MFTKKIMKDNNLVIVDGDEILKVSLQKEMIRHGYQASCLTYGEELPRTLSRSRVDLLVLDISLAGKDGFYWLNWLRNYYTHIPVIVTSVDCDEDQRLQGLEQGAQDFITKPFHSKELLIRIGNVLARSNPNPCSSPNRCLKIGDMELDVDNHCVCRHGKKVSLTQLESRILRLLYLNVGVAVTRDEMMMQIRGTQSNPLDRSIDIHINKLRKKIEDNPAQPKLIRTVRGKGYRLWVA